VRAGIVLQLAGVVAAAAVLDAGVAWAPLAAALAAFGFGAGMASSQLTNVVLSEVPRQRAGSASGVSTTNNAVAAALGVAVLGAVLRVGAVDTGAARSALLVAAALLAAGSAASFAIAGPAHRADPAGERVSGTPAEQDVSHAA
jgi:DHA2 family multidrug resistance protein-like MFS transporter